MELDLLRSKPYNFEYLTGWEADAEDDHAESAHLQNYLKDQCEELIEINLADETNQNFWVRANHPS